MPNQHNGWRPTLENSAMTITTKNFDTGVTRVEVKAGALTLSAPVRTVDIASLSEEQMIDAAKFAVNDYWMYRTGDYDYSHKDALEHTRGSLAKALLWAAAGKSLSNHYAVNNYC